MTLLRSTLTTNIIVSSIVTVLMGGGLAHRTVSGMAASIIPTKGLEPWSITSANPQVHVAVRREPFGEQAIATPQELLAEINRVRTHPAQYAEWLGTLRPYFDATAFYLPNELGIQSEEGTQALDDAILDLSQQSPLPPLHLEVGLLDATQTHLTELLAHNRFTLSGLDGSTPLKRAEQYGTLEGGHLTQVLNQGFRHAENIIASLIIDDGNFNRSTRSLILNPDITKVGSACGVGAAAMPLCVFDYATQYTTIARSTTRSTASSVVSSTGAIAPHLASHSVSPLASNQITEGSSSPIIAPELTTRRESATVEAMVQETNEFSFLLDVLAEDLIAETNLVRSNPVAYAEHLMALRPYYDGHLLKVPGYPIIEVVEGVSALDEAIAVLANTPALRLLEPSKGMALGAIDHATDLRINNQTGHYGSDGSDPFMRIERYGRFSGEAGENISYAPIPEATWHIIQLLIDDNVPNRGHREALLRPSYQKIGSACGAHPTFEIVCVMTYANRYQDNE